MTAMADKKIPARLSAMHAHGRVQPGLRAVPARRPAAHETQWPAVRARFDSAATSEDNRRHWINADALSADAATNVQVRRTLRNRARYEVANNSYARGSS